MDKNGLIILFQEKMAEMEKERDKLSEMTEKRAAEGKPLTDPEILEQSRKCSALSLEMSALKAMRKEMGD